MDSEFHPLVDLLLARMKSHPEEFLEPSPVRINDYITEPGVVYRWSGVSDMWKHLNPKESAAINAAQREIVLDNLHKIALDELLNGEERRRKEREEWEASQKAYSAGGTYTTIGVGSTPAMYPQPLSTMQNYTHEKELMKLQIEAEKAAIKNNMGFAEKAAIKNNMGFAEKLRKVLGV